MPLTDRAPSMPLACATYLITANPSQGLPHCWVCGDSCSQGHRRWCPTSAPKISHRMKTSLGNGDDPISVLPALSRSLAEFSGTRVCVRQHLPTPLGRKLGGGQSAMGKAALAIPSGPLPPLCWVGAFHPRVVCPLLCSVAGLSLAPPPAWMASFPADPFSPCDHPLLLPSFSFPFPAHPWISSPAFPLSAGDRARSSPWNVHQGQRSAGAGEQQAPSGWLDPLHHNPSVPSTLTHPGQ